jgi:shikimate dehydrogenase
MTDRTFLSSLTGSFATSAAQNPTVAIMEAAFADAGLDCRYVNCDVPAERLAAAVHGAVAMGWIGFNCSLPHKVAVLAHLDELEPSAAIIGAVNTVVIQRDDDGSARLVGENTDGQGFVSALRTMADPAGQHVVVLGAGGAARAIAVETALAGALSITIVNRTPERGNALADLVDERTPAAGRYLPWTPHLHVPHGTGILVNATSIGFHPDQGSTPDIDLESLTPGMVVADVVANPPRTRLLIGAAERGCTTLDGLGMLVNQALIAVRLWTGQDVSGPVMRAVLEELLTA